MPNRSIRNLLKSSVFWSVGCTEPGAVAYAAATARRSLGGAVRSVEVTIDPYTYKNALAVVIPNTGGRRGIAVAAALGVLYEGTRSGLEIFGDLDKSLGRRVDTLVARNTVRVHSRVFKTAPHIAVTVTTDEGSATVVLEGSHTTIVRHEVNGRPATVTAAAGKSRTAVADRLADLTLDDIVEYAARASDADIAYFLRGARQNFELAQESMAGRVGAGIGAALETASRTGAVDRGVLGKARSMVAAAVDARMAGLARPVMTSGSSGNQGLATTIPILLAGASLASERHELGRALALGHLLGSYIRTRTGKISTMCGSAVSAAAGAGLGILALHHGWEGLRKLVPNVVSNVIRSITGIICDGANDTCALKLAIASDVAFTTAALAVQMPEPVIRGGIAGESPEEALTNLRRVTESLLPTERIILDILTDR